MAKRITLILIIALMASLCLWFAVGFSVPAYAAGGITITQQPQTLTPFNYTGTTRTLSVTADYSGELGYEWYFRAQDAGSYLDTGIDTPTINVREPKDSGDYYCHVYAKDDPVNTYVDTASARVEIHKAPVTVVIENKTVYYGDSEVALTYDVITAIPDSEDKLGISLSKEEGIDVGEYKIIGESHSDLYYVTFTANGIYEIEKRPVTINVGQMTSTYGEALLPIPYELNENSTMAYDDTIDDLNIEVHKAAGTDVNRYAVEGTFDNSNYDVTFRPAVYTIKPKPIEVRLTGASHLVYTGKAPTIGYEFIGGEYDLEMIITFDKQVKDADNYIAYVRCTDANYTVATPEVAFSIDKADLSIQLKDMIVTVGEEWEPKFIFVGLVEGEDEDVITLPTVNTAKYATAGVYENVMPNGDAVADNYNITLKPGTIQVNVNTVACDKGELKGSFAPDAKLVVSDGEGRYNRIDRIIVNSTMISVEGINGTYSAKLNGIKKFVPLALRACIVDEEGNRKEIKSYGYDEEGNFIFIADSDGELVIYYSLLPVFVIGGALLVIILIIVIVKAVDRRRYRRARNGHYIARQYARYMVEDNKRNYLD